MNDIQLKAELWEIQVILYWLLALALYETGHLVMFWLTLVWSIINFIGAILKAGEGRHKELQDNK